MSGSLGGSESGNGTNDGTQSNQDGTERTDYGDDYTEPREDRRLSHRVHQPEARPDSTTQPDGRGVTRPPVGAQPPTQPDLPGIEIAELRELRAHIEQSTTQWVGPLPDPAALAEYEQVYPGSAERIFRVMESQTVDAAAREDQVATEGIAAAKTGQGWAVFFGVFAMVTAVVFFAVGNNYAGSVLLGPPVLIFIATLIRR